MNILLVSATQKEIEDFQDVYKREEIKVHSIDFLVTGVGIPNTILHLTKILASKKYDLVINVGIAGSFDKNISLGEVVNVTTDVFSEIGAEDGGKFVNFIESGLLNKEDVYFNASEITLHPAIEKLPKVMGITVNTVHGDEKSIKKIQQRLFPVVESMEGAAVFFTCKNHGMNCIQLRSISNHVERRNVRNWNIQLAISNLNKFLKDILL